MYSKGRKMGSKLRHMAHAVSENQHGLVVETAVSVCSPRAERLAGVKMIERLKRVRNVQTVVADKGYHEEDFVMGLKQIGVAAHVPAYRTRRQKVWIDPALYATREYVAGQRRRKWIERFFGWVKTVGGLRKTRHRGLANLDWNFTLAAAAYNLTRIARLMA